ncbi:MAG: zinc metalloprotease HtpX [Candidatus Omnitrophica bacterium]|nr:zinc metalloprotease HtpX [Candidatus Omnitrophota bacterium]
MNTLKTGVLLIVLTLMLIWVGGALGGRQGMIFAFTFALIINFGSYWFSDKIVLKMYKAQPVTEAQAPKLYGMVKELAKEAKIPVPGVYIVNNSSANAFATGRSPEHAAVCVTSGIMDILSGEELKGVIAHELAHIKNRDTLIMTVAATVAGAIMMMANMARWAALFGGYGRGRDRGGNIFGLIAISIIAPIAAIVVQMAISRSREYAADKRGSKIAHSGMGLASALRKLEQAAKHKRLPASPQTAHLFIVNPLKGGFVANLFSTHPPIDERVKRLEQLSS